MKNVYGFILIAWLTAEMILNRDIDIIYTASVLGALCFFIIKSRFLDRTYMSAVFLAGSLLLAYYHPGAVLLLGIPVLDFTYSKKYVIAVPVLTATIYACIWAGNPTFVLAVLSAAFIGYITGAKDENEKKSLSVLDNERRLRYSLEQAQNELLSSRKEIERLTEIRERNRIAHEIHDNMGHSIAGVIFQLEAVLRVIRKDGEKAEEMVRLCSRKLAEALELTRNTVYNLKSEKKLGLEALEKIVEDFQFCPVEFEHTGDFNNIPTGIHQILEANLKELLTNTSKHSKAAFVKISIDVGHRNIRLYYKDNGMGCANINEHTGISGMRDRVRNAGGAFSADGSDGFLVVCNLPVAERDEKEA